MLINILEIINLSWKLYKKHWRELAIYVVFLFVPTLILSLLGLLGSYLDNIAPHTALYSNIIILGVLGLSLVFSVWVTIALTRKLAELILGKKETGWQAVFNSTSHLIWPFIYTYILVGVILALGTIVFIIPGIIFLIWYFFAVYAVIVEEVAGFKALKISKAFVKGRWWGIAWRILVPGVLFILLSIVLKFLVMLPVAFMAKNALTLAIADNLTATLFSSLVTPLASAAVLILYFSARQTVGQTAPAPRHELDKK